MRHAHQCINKMIMGHKRSDIEAGRKMFGEYVTLEWVLERLEKKKCSLPDCSEYLDISGSKCFSIDRIDNNLCHRVDNCQLICRRCQSKKR